MYMSRDGYFYRKKDSAIRRDIRLERLKTLRPRQGSFTPKQFKCK